MTSSPPRVPLFQLLYIESLAPSKSSNHFESTARLDRPITSSRSYDPSSNHIEFIARPHHPITSSPSRVSIVHPHPVHPMPHRPITSSRPGVHYCPVTSSHCAFLSSNHYNPTARFHQSSSLMGSKSSGHLHRTHPFSFFVYRGCLLNKLTSNL